MIFVTVGLHPTGFERLVQAADEMASRIDEAVVIQRGSTRYTPVSSQYFDFADGDQMEEWLSRARLVVTHGGAGSIIAAFHAGKPLVVVPRLKRFGEVIDDHQLELAEALAQQGRAVTVADLSATTLWQAVERVMAQPISSDRRASATGTLQDALKRWLIEQSALPGPWPWRLLGRKC